jgi:hypothetical protein
MGANSVTERSGVLLSNANGGFQAYLTVPGTGEWKEISWRPENYPALRVSELIVTDDELAAHIQKNFVGWVARKMNLLKVHLNKDGEVVAM